MFESLDIFMLRAQYVLPVTLVASMPWLSYRLSRQPHCLQQNFDRFLLTKLTVVTCLLATKLFYVYNLYTSEQSASAIDLVSSVEVFCLIWLFYLQHSHSPTPLAFLSVYLALDLVFKAATLWISDRRTSAGRGYECLLAESFCFKIILLVLHEQSTWNTMKRQFKLKLGREATCGFWSRAFGIPLASSLFRAQNWATPQMEELDDTPVPKELEVSFYDAWNLHGEKQYGLLRSCAAAMIRPVGFAILAKSLVIVITMIIPFWIAFIVRVAEEHIQSDSSDPRHAQLQTMVVLGSFAVFSLRMILQTVMRYSETCIMSNIRSVLTTACFKKLHSLAERTISRHARLSLISRNIKSLENNTDFFFLMNQGVAECVVISILLWQDFGFVITAALLVTPYFAYCIIERYEANVTAARAVLLQKQEDRTNAATDALNSIRSGKVTGNARIQATIVERLRAEEVQARKELQDALWVPHRLSILMHSALPLFALAGNYYWIDGKFSVAAFIKNLMFLCRYMKSSMYAFQWSQRVVQWLECWTRIEDFLRVPDDIADPMAAEIPRQLQHDSNAVVRATAAFIAPETNRQPCVKNASFVLAPNTITVLTGDVATGKSTLLLAMLGQSNVISGSFLVNEGSISYCGQDSWVQNISIQDNIVGDTGFEQQWYDEVIDACLLRSEVNRLPGGSEYVVGTGGAKLDRGQRQRLALARSVYSRARLTLLDDVLSNQSAIAAQHLVVNLFSKDGLLNRGRTVFTTAKIWIPFARAECKFMTINAAGTVSRVNLDNLIDTIPPENTDRDFTEQLVEDPYVNHSIHTIACNELDSEVRFGKASGKASGAGTKRASLNVLFASIDTFTVVKGLVLLTVTIILEVSTVLLFRPWLASKGQDSFSFLLSLPLLIAAPLAWGISARILRNEVAEQISDVFHERLTHAIFNAPYSFFTTENTSTALNMLCETFRTFSTDAYLQGMHLPYHIIDAIVAFGASCFGHFAFVPLFLAILAVTYLLLELQYRIHNPLVQLANLTEFTLRAHFAETASGSAHIRAMNWRRRHVARTSFLINQSQKAHHHVAMYTELSNTVLDFAGVFSLVLFIWFCFRWQLAPYFIGLGCFEIFQVLYIMPWTSQYWNVFNNNLATVTEMNDFIESIPKEVHGPFRPPPPNWPTEGRIVMRDAYIGYDVDGANPVLRNVQFTIRGNSETGFFGHTESGKTSLLLALCRGTHYKGSITLDGVEIRDVGPDVLKRLITIVPEQPTLFYGTTIRQALLPYEIVNPPIGGPGILRAFDRVLYNIGLLDMVNAVGGLEAPMERLKLSPEQLLLFGLGQSLMTFFLDRSPIILIDSVLSRVSSKTFKMMRMMKNDIFKMFEGTVILTSDYPSVVWDSDKMGRIRDGTVSVMEKRALPQGSSRS